MPKLNKDVHKDMWMSKFTVPAGTEVTLIKNASGINGDLYAVKSVALLIELSGNNHDPHYRYCYVDHEDVDE